MNLKFVLARFGPCLLTLIMVLNVTAPNSIFAAEPGPLMAASDQLPALDSQSSPAVPVFSPGLGLAAMGAAATPLTVTTYSWTKTWGGSAGSTTAKSMAMDASGNLFMAGEFSGTVNFDPAGPNPSATFASYNGSVDAFLTKFNASGQYQWAKTWGAGFTNAACPSPSLGCGRDAANSVVVDGTGNAYVAGLYQNTVDFGNGHIAISNAPNGKNNIFLAKFTADGTTQWLRTWGGTTGGALCAYNG